MYTMILKSNKKQTTDTRKNMEKFQKHYAKLKKARHKTLYM